MFSSPSGK